jgi:hypothetical protein
MSQGGVEYLIHTIQLADASLGGLVPNSIETRTYFYTVGSKFIHQLYINHISFELWPLKIQKRRKNVGSLTNYEDIIIISMNVTCSTQDISEKIAPSVLNNNHSLKFK